MRTNEILPLTGFDINQSMEIVWQALYGFREDCIPEGTDMYDQQWDEICTAMAWIKENLDCEREFNE